MLEIKNMCITVKSGIIVPSFSAILPLGSVSVLCGANGSGKSSIVNALIGHPEYELCQGDILFNGNSIKDLAMHERARLGILVIMQQQVIIPGLLMRDYFFQLYMTLYPDAKATINEIKNKIEWAFDFVGLDGSLIDKFVCDGFSGGQKKRFELVHILLLRPSLIILDEVDSGLDADGISLIPRIISWVKNHRPETIWLYITHNQDLIKALSSDQILSLERSLL